MIAQTTVARVPEDLDPYEPAVLQPEAPVMRDIRNYQEIDPRLDNYSYVPRPEHAPEYLVVLLTAVVANNLLKPLFNQIIANFKNDSTSSERYIEQQKLSMDKLSEIIEQLEKDKAEKTTALFDTLSTLSTLTAAVERYTDLLETQSQAIRRIDYLLTNPKSPITVENPQPPPQDLPRPLDPPNLELPRPPEYEHLKSPARRLI